MTGLINKIAKMAIGISLTLFIAALLGGLGTVQHHAVAQVNQNPIADACSGSAANSPVCKGTNTNDPLTGPNGLIAKITKLVGIIVAIGCVFMIMLGGFTYITSNGDSQKVNAAKNTVLYAIIGLVIAAFAQTIVAFVVTKVF